MKPIFIGGILILSVLLSSASFAAVDTVSGATPKKPTTTTTPVQKPAPVVKPVVKPIEKPIVKTPVQPIVQPVVKEPVASKTVFMSIEELKKYDGKKGAKSYVAAYGIIYDVTKVSGWNKIKFKTNVLGTDITSLMKEFPTAKALLKKAKPIAKVKILVIEPVVDKSIAPVEPIIDPVPAVIPETSKWDDEDDDDDHDKDDDGDED